MLEIKRNKLVSESASILRVCVCESQCEHVLLNIALQPLSLFSLYLYLWKCSSSTFYCCCIHCGKTDKVFYKKKVLRSCSTVQSQFRSSTVPQCNHSRCPSQAGKSQRLMKARRREDAMLTNVRFYFQLHSGWQVVVTDNIKINSSYRSTRFI